MDVVDSPGTDDIASGQPLDGTVKGSNFVHKGFYDLLAMLPTGSGTGASAFFASTPGNTVNDELGYFEEAADLQEPADKRTFGPWATYEKKISPQAKAFSIPLNTKKGLPAGPRQDAVQPRVPGLPATRSSRSPEAALPATPTSAGPLAPSSPPAAQSPTRRVPVPRDCFSRPAIATSRLPLSPPKSSAMAVFASSSPKTDSVMGVFASLSPKRDSMLMGKGPMSTVANRVSTFVTPVANAARTIFDASPENAQKTGQQAGGLWGPPRPKVGEMAATSPMKPARFERRPGKIDKRLISWPMEFRHVVHATDAEEAQFILMRWAIDGMGKVADPGWANYMKLLVRQRAADQQARAIAQSIVAREHGARQTTPFHTLKVVNGMPSSVYTLTESSGSPQNPHLHSPSRLTPGIQGNATRWSPLNPIPNPFESAFVPPSSSRTSVDESKEPRDVILAPSPVAPLRVKARKSMPPVITSPLPLRQPITVAPEEIDGMPFPSTPTIVREGTFGLNVDCPVSPGETLATNLSHHLVNSEIPTRFIQPSLPTLEKAASIAIFFETLYHALLKPPPTLQAAHPDNYICGRERRRLALEDEMENRGLRETDKEALRRKWVEAETNNLRDKRRRVGPNSFVKLTVIGHGAFGVVSLVKEKETGGLYAMKELRKSDMFRKGQEGHVRAEKDLLAAAATASDATSRWIVKLHYSFQDVDRLYLVLDFEGGGDLLNLLVERDTFDEGFTKFYVAEMIMALQATHKLGFIHRDVKPDNFLFSKDGHLKISDFGLANSLHWAYDTAYYEQQRRALLKRHGIDLEEPTKGKMRTFKQREMEAVMTQEWRNNGQGVLTWRDNKRRRMAFSVCGTNSYMSPEVIRGMGYGFSCDWWSLGVIAFECLYGYPPFVSNSRHLTRQKILNWRETLRFPTKPKVSRDCADFLTKLLCEPEDRLGSMATSSTKRPNSIMLSERNAGMVSLSRNSAPKTGLGDDGAAEIKAHPWFKMMDWDNLHLQVAPYQPNLRNEADTQHFEDDIADEPLVAAGGVPADATRDPMLADKKHGGHLLELRKGMAFAGWTYKANKQNIHEQFDELLQRANLPDGSLDADGETVAIESWTQGRSRPRALSL